MTSQEHEHGNAMKHNKEMKEFANKAEEKKAEVKDVKHEHKHDVKHEEKKEMKEAKHEEKKETKETKVQKISKKEEAVAKGLGLHISMKQSKYICEFIKGKKIDDAIADLVLVTKMKKIVPFRGEYAHRKGKGMMSGKWPISASKEFINILKALKGNCIVNGLDLDKTRIYFGSASFAAQPYKSGGRKAKRANLIIKAKEIIK